MPTGHIDLITIAREYGAGGSELAAQLGARLGWPVLDRAIVHQVAERLALEDAAVERLDERAPGVLARLATMLLVTPPEAPVLPDLSGVLAPDAVAEATRAVLLEAARTPPLLVVGHGAASLFAARPGTLHLRLVAPIEDRVRRVADRTRWGAAAAAAQARQMDADRARYVARYYHADWRDPLRYDWLINTGRVTIPEVVALVAQHVAAARSAAAVG